jgi:hypothetical protein
MTQIMKFLSVRLQLAAVVTLLAPLLWFNTAHASNRVALVIGNAQYEKNPLANPTNDSRDVAAKLKKFGFDVVYRENLKIRQVGGMMKEFKTKLTPNSTALVFYAGHGLQIRGENFFPVVDADIQSEEDIPVQSISLKQIMDILEDALNDKADDDDDRPMTMNDIMELVVDRGGLGEFTDALKQEALLELSFPQFFPYGRGGPADLLSKWGTASRTSKIAQFANTALRGGGHYRRMQSNFNFLALCYYTCIRKRMAG